MINAKKILIVGVTLLTTSIITQPAAQQPQQPPQPLDVLFWGITDKKGAPELTEMSRAIRNEFALNPDIRLIDELAVARITREKERLGQESMDNSLPSSAGIPDSAAFIRGVVEEFAMTIGRSLLFWGKINARLTLRFSFTGPSGGNAYHGEFGAGASRTKDFIFLRSAPKVIHISAIDRTELAAKMQSQIVKEVSKFAAQYFAALKTGDEGAGTAVDVGVGDDVDGVDNVGNKEDTPQFDENADFSDALGEEVVGD